MIERKSMPKRPPSEKRGANVVSEKPIVGATKLIRGSWRAFGISFFLCTKARWVP